MRLVQREEINPEKYALGAKAALEMLAETDKREAGVLLDDIWNESKAGQDEKDRIKKIISRHVFAFN